jgi:UDP-N-acetyl-D-glucosamine dehydrogenase
MANTVLSGPQNTYPDSTIRLCLRSGVQGGVFKESANFHRRLQNGYNLVIVTTAHTKVDYDMVAQNAQAVFDTKNVMKNIARRENVEAL